MFRRTVGLVFVFGVLYALLPRSASAQNTTSGGAHSFMVGGAAAEDYFDNTTHTERWYHLTSTTGRSYCAETQGGVMGDDSVDSVIDTALTIYDGNATTVLASNDDAIILEPAGFVLSRACWIAPANGAEYIKVTPHTAGQSFAFRLKLVETTLYSNWFFVGGDYNAYALLRNTTKVTVNYTINWRNAAGTIVAFSTGSLPSNGSVFKNARDFPAVLGAVSGTVEIVHDGSAGAIMATSTILSVSTGLSFDTIFQARPTW